MYFRSFFVAKQKQTQIQTINVVALFSLFYDEQYNVDDFWMIHVSYVDDFWMIHVSYVDDFWMIHVSYVDDFWMIHVSLKDLKYSTEKA